MSLPITVQYQWVADELIKAQKWHIRSLIRPLYLWLFLIILAYTIIDGAHKIFATDEKGLGIVLLASSLFLTTYPWISGPWLARRGFSKLPDRETTITWSISENDLCVTNLLGSSTLKWDALQKIVITPDGILLYTTAQIFNWLPRHSFHRDADFARLEELAGKYTQTFWLPASNRAKAEPTTPNKR